MKLSDVPWDQIKIGDRVISYIGNPGTITDKYENKMYQVFDEDRYFIRMVWDNGNVSFHQHYMLEFVTYEDSEA